MTGGLLTWVLIIKISAYYAFPVPGYGSYAECMAAARLIVEAKMAYPAYDRAVCIPGPVERAQ